MKEELIGKSLFKSTKGFITLEILIAFTIIILCIGAVALLIFGNQFLAVDLQTNNEAIPRTIKILENARAKARQDFLAVNSFSVPQLSGPLTFTESLQVKNITTCRKQAISMVSWFSGSRLLTTKLDTVFSDIKESLALGGDCFSKGLNGDWHNPQILTSIARSDLDNIDTYALDVFNNNAYIVGGAIDITKPDIVIIDGSNLPSALPIIPGQELVQRDRKNESVKYYKAVDVARHNTTGKYYAYIYTGNDANTNQFQIIDVSDSNNISTTPVVRSFPPSTPANSGESIFYYKNKVYVGIGYNVSNPELQIYDVVNPLNPVSVGSYNVNHNINKIIVRDQIISGVQKTLAYVAVSASSGSPEFIIYDVTNPGNVFQIGNFNPPGNAYGLSLYLLGNFAYLGRAGNSVNPNFYIIDISDPSNPTSCLTCRSVNTILPFSEDVNDLVVVNGMAFLVTGNALRILNIDNQNNITRPISSPFGVFPTPLTSIDLDAEKGLIYATHKNQSNIALYVFYSAP